MEKINRRGRKGIRKERREKSKKMRFSSLFLFPYPYLCELCETFAFFAVQNEKCWPTGDIAEKCVIFF